MKTHATFSGCARLAVLLSPVSLVLTSLPAWAQAPAQLASTVVTASRTAQRADELVSDVVVIRRADIEKSTGRTLPEILARAPGVQFSANGGLGKNSSVSIRGAEARHTVLLIDGVRFGSATSGSPNWDTIPVDMIERIEILKGPASALYGSEAVGGVVQIFMRKGVEGLAPYASVTLGSYGHRQVTAGVGGGSGPLTYSLGVQHTRDKGFSTTNPKVQFGNYNPDTDGFDQDSLNTSVAYQLSPDWKIDAGLLAADSTNHSDDGLNRDTQYKGKTRVVRTGVEGRVLPSWKTQLRYSQGSDSSRALVAAPSVFPSLFKTTQNQLTWQNDVDTPIGVVLAGVERLEQKIDSTTAYTVTERTVSSAFVGLNGSAGSHSWQVNARRDKNSQFGGSSTGFGGYGFAITPQWRVNASYGTSFVAPSFNQLYFPNFGNALLQPERGRNTDLGVTWSDAGHTVKLTHFDNKIRGFISNTTIASSIPRARIDGYTLAYNGSFGALSLNASLDAMDPRNELTGKRLARRSSNLARLGADYAVGEWALGGNVMRAGNSFDDAANVREVAGRTTADLYVDYAVNTEWKLQTKLNNVTNKQYETIYGYNQPGRAVYVTLSYRPKL
ncbi:MAG: TonB-dependent receptor domain-containing protein [Polaromonas sp.]